MKRFVLLFVSAIAVASVWSQANTGVYYRQRASLFEYLPISSSDIVMLGNSLTDGGEWSELLNNKHVKNRGIVGDILQGYIERLEPVLKGKPKKIFILGGVNDVSHDVSADSIARVTEKLILLIKERCPNTKIYLQSLLPFNTEVQMWKNLKGREQVVKDANVLLEQVAKRMGVTWINLYPLYDDGTGKLRRELTNDGLHLLGPGYLMWRDAIKPYI